MMRRKVVSLLTMLMVLMFATSVFAANRVEVKVTSQPVALHGTGEKAGGYTLEFDAGTTIESGDQITIDLPLSVALSRDIELYIPYAGVDTGAASGVNAASTGTLFTITGDEGTQRVRLDVSGADLVVGGAEGDHFTLKFFDQQAAGIEDADGVAITSGDINTRCIDVSGTDAETINDALDSAADKYTFIPSNPQVAHVVAANNYSIYSCDKTALGKIRIGNIDVSGQDGEDIDENCSHFDLENGNGYCYFDDDDYVTRVNKLIIASSSDLPLGEYTVSLEIVTDGIYWTDQSISSWAFATTLAACEGDSSLGSDSTGDISYEDEDGDEVDAVDFTAQASCSVDPGDAAKTLTATLSQNASGARALQINVPTFAYDLDEVTAGDTVEINVVITQAPCGSEIINARYAVGVMGCDASTGGKDLSLVFPYFTEITGSSYWSGFSIANMGGTDGTATLTIYEADGDVFTASVDIDSHSMVTMNTSELLDIATQVSGTGELGDSRFYMMVGTDFWADGFAMLADPATGESMGYLPRSEYWY